MWHAVRARIKQEGNSLQKTFVWIIVGLLVMIAVVLYGLRSHIHLEVTPDARRAIEAAKHR
jgi:hypothetical protein